jgi:hypothetical protein
MRDVLPAPHTPLGLCHGGPDSLARGEAAGGGPLPPSRQAKGVEVEGASSVMEVRPALTGDGDDVASYDVSREGGEEILGLGVRGGVSLMTKLRVRGRGLTDAGRGEG